MYITHPAAVAAAVSEAAKPAAWLHDVLEDNLEQFNWLTIVGLGVDLETVAAVLALTKHNGEDYFDYIANVKKNLIAREVKIADIEHNLASDPKLENVEKYKQALEILKAD